MENIILIGMMGCGKSVIGALVAQQMRMDFVDLDDYLEMKFQMTIPKMFAIGEDYFRQKETAILHDVKNFTNTVVSCGGGVIMKDENIELLKKAGIVIFIDRPIANIVADVDCLNRPLLKDGPQKLYELDEIRRPKYLKAATYRVVNDGSVDQVVTKIKDIIKKG